MRDLLGLATNQPAELPQRSNFLTLGYLISFSDAPVLPHLRATVEYQREILLAIRVGQ